MEKIVFQLDPEAWHGSSTESLWVEPLGGDLYRLENSPFYAFDVSYLDIVRGVRHHELLAFDGVASRGGHSTYRIICLPDQRPRFSAFWKPLSAIGCTFEVGSNILYSLDVLPEADIFAVVSFLERGEADGVWSFEEGHCGHCVSALSNKASSGLSADSVFVDYGNADADGAIRLIAQGTEADLLRLGIELAEGVILNMSDGEIRSVGVVSRRDGYWVAVITRCLDS